MILKTPSSPFEPVPLSGDSVTVETDQEFLILPTDDPNGLPLYNQWVLNPYRLTRTDSPFGGLKGSMPPDYSVGTLKTSTSGVQITDLSGANGNSIFPAGKLVELGLLAIDTEAHTITIEAMVSNSTASDVSAVVDCYHPDQISSIKLYNYINSIYTLDESIVFESVTHDIGVKNGTSFSIPVPLQSSKQFKLIINYEIGITRTLTPPSGFGWTSVPIEIKAEVVLGTGADTRFYTDLDPASYKPTGKTYYVDISSGSDSNNGLSSGTAYKSITKALAMTDVDVISVAPGIYSRGATAGMGEGLSLSITRNVSIICPDGRAEFSLRNVFTAWAQNATYSNVYQVARSSVKRVFDRTLITEYGDYTELSKVTSLSAVAATAGTWYTDNVTVYIRCYSDRIPDADICAFLGNEGSNLLYSNTGVTIYLENIDIEGGYTPVLMNTGAFYAKNCSFKYSIGGNGLTMQATNSVLKNCTAAKNSLDGFNYHTSGGVICSAIEIDCIGRDNGIVGGPSSCNGSTSHESNNVIRLNGTYMRNYGPNVADVLGCHTWNINCNVYGPMLSASVTDNAGFYARDADTNGRRMIMWLYSCTVSDDFYYSVYAGASTDIYQTDIRAQLEADVAALGIESGNTTYIFIDSNNASYGLQNLSNPWIAVYDPDSSVIDFFLFIYRPKNFEYTRNETGKIKTITLYPGNGVVYHGQIIHYNLTLDSNSDYIPDCLDASIKGSISLFLQSYGMVV